jgi:hypothetical protein
MAWIVVFILALANPALGEVCDKVAHANWQPEHGPGVFLGFGPIPTVAVAGLIALGTLVGWLKPWFALSLGGFAIVIAAFAIADIYADHRIIQTAQREGCRALWADLVCLAAGAAVFAMGFVRQYVWPSGALVRTGTRTDR